MKMSDKSVTYSLESLDVKIGPNAHKWKPADMSEDVGQESFGDITVSELEQMCHAASKEAGWWDGVDVEDIVPTKLCLIHSEISEAMEGHRKNLMDDKLPHRKMIEVELADAVIRIFDLAGALGLNVTEAALEKMEYNKTRADHKPENRAKSNGKKY
jgi:NTP pyrophosphatase (non-canonical NTP hydrolase)